MRLLASATTSTLRVVPGAPAPVGDPQFIVASLLSSLRRPVVVADNARLTATGSASGAIALGALALQTDNTWDVRFVPPRQETVTLRLFLDGVLAHAVSLVVSGLSPTAADTAGSLRQAVLTSQASAVTVAVANGSNTVIFMGEDSLLSIPVVDKSGTL
jgi:hypothetical protein